jgi:hypothetical protein
VKHTKFLGKNEHFSFDNSCTGYVPPSKAQKEGTILKSRYHESFLNFLETDPIKK